MKQKLVSLSVLSLLVAGAFPIAGAAQETMSPYQGDTAQLAAGIGLSPEQASGLSLSQLNALKYQRGGNDPEWRPFPGTVSERSAPPSTAQLAAGIGLTPDEASGLTLADLNAIKYARDGNERADPVRVYGAAARSDRPTPDLTQLAGSARVPGYQAASFSLDEVAAARTANSSNRNH